MKKGLMYLTMICLVVLSSCSKEEVVMDEVQANGGKTKYTSLIQALDPIDQVSEDAADIVDGFDVFHAPLVDCLEEMCIPFGMIPVLSDLNFDAMTPQNNLDDLTFETADFIAFLDVNLSSSCGKTCENGMMVSVLMTIQNSYGFVIEELEAVQNGDYFLIQKFGLNLPQGEYTTTIDIKWTVDGVNTCGEGEVDLVYSMDQDFNVLAPSKGEDYNSGTTGDCGGPGWTFEVIWP